MWMIVFSSGLSTSKNVDMIVALGMAKEGFDWIWCEHALTVGYRSSLTEIVQTIGRATRDAPPPTPPMKLSPRR
jgi:superfamily II DNA or RNA helicase